MPGEQHILIVFANCHKDNGIFAKRLLVSHGPLTAKIRSTDMAIEAEQRIKLESMQIKGIRWMIWQNIDRRQSSEHLEKKLWIGFVFRFFHIFRFLSLSSTYKATQVGKSGQPCKNIFVETCPLSAVSIVIEVEGNRRRT